MRAFSLFGTPEGIGPAGTNTVGRCPNVSAPMSRPGTILSHTPRHSVASNIPCASAIPVDIAITSRLNKDSSIPVWPCVTPSHMAGTPPATWAVAPASRAACLMRPGKRSNGW